jgi:uncharacterized coiled-coil protein SlyX
MPPNEANNAAAERIRELEIKTAFLERHVEEQDRAMLDNFRQLERLRKDCERLSDALKTLAAGRDDSSRLSENEKPPHY